MKITLADHYGMCFGVRDALRKTHEAASRERITVLGELVHNPVVRRQLSDRGVGEASLEAWNEFESGFAARLVDELTTLAPDDPSRAEVADALRGQLAAYRRGYRGILGFAWLCLIAC